MLISWVTFIFMFNNMHLLFSNKKTVQNDGYFINFITVNQKYQLLQLT